MTKAALVTYDGHVNGPRLVVAARTAYSYDDPRYIANRVVDFMVNGPGKSIIGEALFASGVRASSCLSSIEALDGEYYHLIEFDVIDERSPQQRADLIRRSLDMVGRSAYSQDDLNRAKYEATSILFSSVSSMTEYLDCSCGFIVDSGDLDSLNSYVSSISKCTLDVAMDVIRDVYRGDEFSISEARVGDVR